MSATQEFPTAEVLSCTTGVLLCQDIGGVYRVLDYTLSDSLMTHQLPHASRVATPHLISLHPWLADLDPPRDRDALLVWLGEVEREHGATLAITPDPDPQWVKGNALKDLFDLRPDAQVIVVETDR